MRFIDAAFQLISEKGESGYKQKTAIFNANNVESTENAELPIGWVEIGDDSWTGNARGTAVLGISNDFKFSFSIGFVRDKKTLVVKPIINRLNASGDNDYFVLDDNLKMRVSNGVILTQEQEEEIKKLLDEASNINFVKKEPTVNRVNWNKDDIFS